MTGYHWSYTRRWEDFVADPESSMRYAYPMHHIWVNYEKIASLTIGVINLPRGKPVRVGLGPIKALPLEGRTIANPTVTVGGATLSFPVELASGSYLEYLGTSDCKVYDAKGECIATVTPLGAAPVLAHGDNVCALSVTPGSGGRARATVTVMSYGDPLQ